MEALYCHIRKEWVNAQPEEYVRQNLIRLMIEELGYPASHLVLEKQLGQMPHLVRKDPSWPNRRADIICFAKGIHPVHSLYPLLLVECKAIKLSPKVINQVAGYNYYLKSFFIAIANQEEIRTGWYDPLKNAFNFISRLPSYPELMAQVLSTGS